MVASDKVLRGGLTDKRVDVPELVRLVRFDQGSPALVPPERAGAITRYRPPAPFEVVSVTPTAEAVRLPLVGAAILVAEGDGQVTLSDGTTASLARGVSYFVPATQSEIRLSGPGPFWLAISRPGTP